MTSDPSGRAREARALPCVGLGGGIGSGKSTVAAALVALGALHVDTDALYHDLLERDLALREGLRGLFGDEVFDEGGRPSRGKMRARLQQQPELFQALEALAHPAIFSAVDTRARSNAGGAPYLIVEAPLLFESGLDARVAFSVYVTADLETRWRRVKARSGLSREHFDAIVARQLDTTEARARAEIVLENDGDLAALPGRIEGLHQDILAKLSTLPARKRPNPAHS